MAYRGGFPPGTNGAPGIFSLRREIDQLFEDAFGGAGAGAGASGRAGAAFTPSVDVREDARELTIHMDLPGVRPEEVELSVENGLLTVRGERRPQRKEGDEGRYHFVERRYGRFTRSFQLPQGVNETRISAEFEHGELVIRIPKPEAPKPRRIEIGRAGSAAGSSGAQEVTAGAGADSAPARGRESTTSNSAAGSDTPR